MSVWCSFIRFPRLCRLITWRQWRVFRRVGRSVMWIHCNGDRKRRNIFTSCGRSMYESYQVVAMLLWAKWKSLLRFLSTSCCNAEPLVSGRCSSLSTPKGFFFFYLSWFFMIILEKVKNDNCGPCIHISEMCWDLEKYCGRLVRVEHSGLMVFFSPDVSVKEHDVKSFVFHCSCRHCRCLRLQRGSVKGAVFYTWRSVYFS